jgi:hypothetical protein
MAEIGIGRFPTVELKGDIRNLNTRNLIEKAFANSPLLNGDYSHENMKRKATEILNGPNQVVEGNILLPNQRLDYSKNGDNKVAVGGGGLPSTRFTPNLTSPGQGNGVDAGSQQDMKIEPKDINDTVEIGKTDGTKSPFTNAASTKIGQNINLGETIPPTRPFKFNRG